MTVVVLGLDALDPVEVNSDRHPNLTLADHRPIETFRSSTGTPSTHELWPTIITGLPPEEHGLTLDDGVAWESSVLRHGSAIAQYLLPDSIQSKIGAWLLNRGNVDAFRTPATYYEDRGISTLFDGRSALSIGIPNYVTEGDEPDQEHVLRSSLGTLFERDPNEETGHRTADIQSLFDRCIEMAIWRISRVRYALRKREFELIFGYTSALDLIGHVVAEEPEMYQSAYDEMDVLVGDVRRELRAEDELLLVSDHGLQDGIHTEQAMVAGTDPDTVNRIRSVFDVREAIEATLEARDHTPPQAEGTNDRVRGPGKHIESHLEELGYL